MPMHEEHHDAGPPVEPLALSAVDDQSEDGVNPTERGISRKALLKAAVSAGFAVPLVTGGVVLAQDAAAEAGSAGGDGPAVPQATGPLAVTPACHDGDEPTIPEIEGPYFKPNSPLRTNLVTSGVTGTPLTITGHVYGLACAGISAALLDFWQADNGGNYDNVGFTLRGHQFTDANGNFTLTTIVPGLYPGRTRHIHVKVQAPGQPILTTQLYFPGEPQNATDAYYDSRLLMNVTQSGGGERATFDFVMNVPQNPPPTSSSSPSTPPSSSSSPSTPPTSSSSPPSGNAWQPNHAYKAGDVVTYGGRSYKCLQGHTSQVGWEPPNVPALWQAL